MKPSRWPEPTEAARVKLGSPLIVRRCRFVECRQWFITKPKGHCRRYCSQSCKDAAANRAKLAYKAEYDRLYRIRERERPGVARARSLVDTARYRMARDAGYPVVEAMRRRFWSDPLREEVN